MQHALTRLAATATARGEPCVAYESARSISAGGNGVSGNRTGFAAGTTMLDISHQTGAEAVAAASVQRAAKCYVAVFVPTPGHCIKAAVLTCPRPWRTIRGASIVIDP